MAKTKGCKLTDMKYDGVYSSLVFSLFFLEGRVGIQGIQT